MNGSSQRQLTRVDLANRKYRDADVALNAELEADRYFPLQERKELAQLLAKARQCYSINPDGRDQVVTLACESIQQFNTYKILILSKFLTKLSAPQTQRIFDAMQERFLGTHGDETRLPLGVIRAIKKTSWLREITRHGLTLPNIQDYLTEHQQAANTETGAGYISTFRLFPDRYANFLRLQLLLLDDEVHDAAHINQVVDQCLLPSEVTKQFEGKSNPTLRVFNQLLTGRDITLNDFSDRVLARITHHVCRGFTVTQGDDGKPCIDYEDMSFFGTSMGSNLQPHTATHRQLDIDEYLPELLDGDIVLDDELLRFLFYFFQPKDDGFLWRVASSGALGHGLPKASIAWRRLLNHTSKLTVKTIPQDFPGYDSFKLALVAMLYQQRDNHKLALQIALKLIQQGEQKWPAWTLFTGTSIKYYSISGILWRSHTKHIDATVAAMLPPLVGGIAEFEAVNPVIMARYVELSNAGIPQAEWPVYPPLPNIDATTEDDVISSLISDCTSRLRLGTQTQSTPVQVSQVIRRKMYNEILDKCIAAQKFAPLIPIVRCYVEFPQYLAAHPDAALQLFDYFIQNPATPQVPMYELIKIVASLAPEERETLSIEAQLFVSLYLEVTDSDNIDQHRIKTTQLHLENGDLIEMMETYFRKLSIVADVPDDLTTKFEAKRYELQSYNLLQAGDPLNNILHKHFPHQAATATANPNDKFSENLSAVARSFDLLMATKGKSKLHLSKEGTAKRKILARVLFNFDLATTEPEKPSTDPHKRVVKQAIAEITNVEQLTKLIEHFSLMISKPLFNQARRFGTAPDSLTALQEWRAVARYQLLKCQLMDAGMEVADIFAPDQDSLTRLQQANFSAMQGFSFNPETDANIHALQQEEQYLDQSHIAALQAVHPFVPVAAVEVNAAFAASATGNPGGKEAGGKRPPAADPAYASASAPPIPPDPADEDEGGAAESKGEEHEEAAELELLSIEQLAAKLEVANEWDKCPSDIRDAVRQCTLTEAGDNASRLARLHQVIIELPLYSSSPLVFAEIVAQIFELDPAINVSQLGELAARRVQTSANNVDPCLYLDKFLSTKPVLSRRMVSWILENFTPQDEAFLMHIVNGELLEEPDNLETWKRLLNATPEMIEQPIPDALINHPQIHLAIASLLEETPNHELALQIVLQSIFDGNLYAWPDDILLALFKPKTLSAFEDNPVVIEALSDAFAYSFLSTHLNTTKYTRESHPARHRELVIETAATCLAGRRRLHKIKTGQLDDALLDYFLPETAATPPATELETQEGKGDAKSLKPAAASAPAPASAVVDSPLQMLMHKVSVVEQNLNGESGEQFDAFKQRLFARMLCRQYHLVTDETVDLNAQACHGEITASILQLSNPEFLATLVADFTLMKTHQLFTGEYFQHWLVAAKYQHLKQVLVACAPAVATQIFPKNGHFANADFSQIPTAYNDDILNCLTQIFSSREGIDDCVVDAHRQEITRIRNAMISQKHAPAVEAVAEIEVPGQVTAAMGTHGIRAASGDGAGDVPTAVAVAPSASPPPT